MSNEQVRYTFLEGPSGNVLVAKIEAGLTRIDFQEGPKPVAVEPMWQRDDEALSEAIVQLRAYFYEGLTQFDLPLAPIGTDFQKQVWKVLESIPFGETMTYQQVAERIGRPTASRAVGAANGRNPLPIVVPCHRVIGSNGRLTGYAGGLEIKEALLNLERGHASESTPATPTQRDLKLAY